MDIGSGRGADIRNLLVNRCNTILAYELDSKNNIEYYGRIIETVNKEGIRKIPLTYIVVNGEVPISPTIQQLNIFKINFFESNYVIHYLCQSEENIKKLKSMILSFS